MPATALNLLCINRNVSCIVCYTPADFCALVSLKSNLLNLWQKRGQSGIDTTVQMDFLFFFRKIRGKFPGFHTKMGKIIIIVYGTCIIMRFWPARRGQSSIISRWQGSCLVRSLLYYRSGPPRCGDLLLKSNQYCLWKLWRNGGIDCRQIVIFIVATKYYRHGRKLEPFLFVIHQKIVLLETLSKGHN